MASWTIAQDPPIGPGEATLLIVLISALLLGSAGLSIWIAKRTASGALGPNGWAGIRTKATRRSSEAWLAGHKAAEKLMVAGGLVMVVSTIISAVLAFSLDDGDPERRVLIWSGAIGVGTVLLLALTIAGAIKGNNAAKAV